MLRRQIDLQEQAISKYGTAIQESNKRIKDAQDRQKNYTQELERAKEKHAQLKAEKDKLRTAMAAEKKANGDNTMAYLEMDASLEQLNDEIKKTEKAISDAEKGYARADKTIANADKNVQKLTIAQNEAKAAMAGMKTQLDQLEGSFNKHSASLQKASAKWKAYSDAAISAGQAQERVGRTLSRASAVIV